MKPLDKKDLENVLSDAYDRVVNKENQLNCVRTILWKKNQLNNCYDRIILREDEILLDDKTLLDEVQRQRNFDYKISEDEKTLLDEVIQDKETLSTAISATDNNSNIIGSVFSKQTRKRRRTANRQQRLSD